MSEEHKFFAFVSPEELSKLINLKFEVERLREALKLERQLRDDALRAFNEARAALKEGE